MLLAFASHFATAVIRILFLVLRARRVTHVVGRAARMRPPSPALYTCFRTLRIVINKLYFTLSLTRAQTRPQSAKRLGFG